MKFKQRDNLLTLIEVEIILLTNVMYCMVPLAVRIALCLSTK